DIRPKYRPQLKRELFPRDGKHAGKALPPRYVGSLNRKRFITLIIPKMYRNETTNLFVQVVWLTVSHNGQIYYNPNKFQCDNKNEKLQDRNPIYYKVNQHVDVDTGQLTIKLVCIRSKLDELLCARAFRPFRLDGQLIESIISLTSAELKQYKLEQSQLAFTLCRYNGNNQQLNDNKKGAPLAFDINEDEIQVLHETTFISKIMTEQEKRQRKKTSTPIVKTAKAECHRITCIHCGHKFAPERSVQATKRQASPLIFVAAKKQRQKSTNR
ncbi:unnamed protein product, partial [Didymodactylos carnosus]